MKVTGEVTIEALMEWYRGYVSRYPGLDLDLGKFYFSTSVGTAGALVAFEKIDTTSTLTSLLITAFLFLAMSIVLSFVLILPARIRVDDNPDVKDIYQKVSGRINRITLAWFISWVSGAVIGVINAIMA